MSRHVGGRAGQGRGRVGAIGEFPKIRRLHQVTLAEYVFVAFVGVDVADVATCAFLGEALDSSAELFIHETRNIIKIKTKLAAT